ncbi:hypothetical protein SAMN03159312_4394 [Pseudomonas sp. NFIX49]|nr:hypothetical protein SAMN03159313_4964 [Pseudomonas sp. NFIX46]SDB48220.1 hypothetical protein SAMN03097715_03644 [Pseudomonas putida]SFQ91413.1 hypothetical protein SAMN03159312_4394 [Pseudomonas sp. NFIX49]
MAENRELRMNSEWERWCRDIHHVVDGLVKEVAEMKQEQIVEKQISAFIQLNEKLMNNANAYTNLIMVAGYAGYFAFWSTLSGKLPTWLFNACGLSITLSLTLFITWEIVKMFWSAKHMRATQAILSKRPHASVISEFEKAFQDFSTRSQKVWLVFLVPTVVSGMTAACLLIGYFCLGLAGMISTA